MRSLFGEGSRWRSWAPKAAVVLYLAVYGFGLRFPSVPIYVEERAILTVARSDTPQEYKALPAGIPPLVTALAANLIRFVGDVPFVWRLPSFAAGLGLIFVVYALTKALTRNARTAFLAALLFGLDGAAFVQARVLSAGTVMLFFALLSILCLLRHSLLGIWSREKAFLLSGISFGLALSSQWKALAVAVLWLYFYRRLFAETAQKRRLLFDTGFAFLLPAAAVYFLSFFLLPFLLPGFKAPHLFEWIIAAHRETLAATSDPGYARHYLSPGWTWPFLIKPVIYYWDHKTFYASGIVKEIRYLSSPVIAWLMPVACLFTARMFFKCRSQNQDGRPYLFILFGIFSQWLLAALFSKPPMNSQFYPAIPFLCMAIAVALDRLLDTPGRGRDAAAVYLALVFAMFVYWYPLWNGIPVSSPYWKHHKWLESWY